MPELYDHSSNLKTEDIGNYTNNTINPALSSTWNFIEKIIQEISDLFSYNVIHVGLDERPNSAWEGSQKIKEMMREKNLVSYGEVQDFYMNKVIHLLNIKKKITAAWNEGSFISPYRQWLRR